MILDKVVTNGVALDVPAHMSVGQTFLDKVRGYGEREGTGKVALVNGNTGEETTYAGLLQSTVNIAVGLKNLGVKPGDVVGVCGDSRSEYIAAAMGAVCCGAIATFVNALFTQEEMVHVLNISRPCIIFCTTSALKAHLSTFEGTQSIQHIVQLDGDPTVSGVLALSSVETESDARCYEAEEVRDGKDTAMIFYSSGTTGLPKGVMLSHINILYIFASYQGGYTVKHCNNFLTILPWYHVYGLISSLIILINHKRLVCLSGFNPEKYLNLIQEYQINCLMLAPPVVVFIAKSPLVEKYDTSSVEGIWCGAAPLSEQTMEQLRRRMPNFKKLIEGYGMTETTMGVLKCIDEIEAKRGLRPIPGVKVKIVDCETREKLGPNEKGEVCVKGPVIMKGYIGNDGATRDAFDEEGYLKTGDIGYYNDEEHFFIIDRLKEIIKYKGHQVAPAAVESIVLQHSAVVDCGVVGKPDEVAGELPTAFVVLKPGAMVTESDILDFTATKLSPIARLRGGVIFLNEIPKNPSGKILRRLLKQKLLGRD